MRYSIEPKDVDSATKSTTEAINTASKRAIQKTAETTGDLIGNKTADNITSISKKSTKKLPNDETEANRYISKDAGEANLKDAPKKDTYLQKKEGQYELRLA